MKKIINFKNILFILLFIFITISLASCGSTSTSTKAKSTADSSTINDVVETNGRNVIYRISYDYEGKEMKNTIRDIKNKIIEFDGYISESRNQEDYSTYSYKVPTDKVNELLDYIDSVDGFYNKIITTVDVTSTYSSVNSALERLNAKKKIYEDELSNTNLTTDEKIKYINLIESIDYEIEEYYSRKDRLEGELNYSTLTISYRLDKSGEWAKDFGNVMLHLLKFIGITAAISAPFVIAGGIVFIVLKKKKIKNEKGIE